MNTAIRIHTTNVPSPSQESQADLLADAAHELRAIDLPSLADAVDRARIMLGWSAPESPPPESGVYAASEAE